MILLFSIEFHPLRPSKHQTALFLSNRMNNENGKSSPIRVFGLSESEQSSLCALAVMRYGKDSISLLLKKTAQSLLEQAAEPEPVSLDSGFYAV